MSDGAREPTWAGAPTTGAACEALPFDKATDLFMPVGDGGAMRRTRAYPAPDSHLDARLVCARCPILEPCLVEGLSADAWTFRGGLSPEERAAFGGYRDSEVAGRREVYLTRPQVWSRIVLSGLPVPAVRRVLERWRDYLSSGDEDVLGGQFFQGPTGGGRTPHEMAQKAGVLDHDDWFVEHVPAPRTRRRESVEPVQDALPLVLASGAGMVGSAPGARHTRTENPT